jgi:hypothetical protein
MHATLEGTSQSRAPTLDTKPRTDQKSSEDLYHRTWTFEAILVGSMTNDMGAIEDHRGHDRAVFREGMGT